MDIFMIATVCFFVFLAGFIDSIAGGGGLISLPAYVAAGLPPHLALATNKFSSACGTLTSTARFIKSGKINWGIAVFSVPFAFLGSALGANLALITPENVIKYLMLVAVPIVCVFTLVNKNMDKEVKKDYSKAKAAVLSSMIGFFLGMYDGFFGPGMGMFLMLAYVNVMGLDVVTSGGNAKIVNLSSNLAALATFLLSGNVVFEIGIPAAVCGILGNYLGSGMAIKNGSKVIKPIMVVVMILLLGQILSDLI